MLLITRVALSLFGRTGICIVTGRFGREVNRDKQVEALHASHDFFRVWTCSRSRWSALNIRQSVVLTMFSFEISPHVVCMFGLVLVFYCVLGR